MTELADIIYETVMWFYLAYAFGVALVYSWMGVYALGAVMRYKRDNTFTDYGVIAANPNAPIFSLIAPAYNEGMTIVENVRSLLSLYYHNLEIIIVNDGSKDDSIQKLIEAYELESVNFFIQGEIPTANVKAIYKSKNPAFKKLIVVDKENGGKADALNVGVNVSSGEYLVCIDVDCILEQDAILRLAKPFLEQTDKRLIACGGVIRLANNCRIQNGKVVEVNLPRTLLGRTQVLEYIRAFVLGRMAWSRASGLILISGAFGVFDRKIVLECGGYDKNTVGEDMELVVRMRKHLEEKGEPYEVITIPDPLCWTEAPESKEILNKQRNRWMRGTMETLWKHRSMMFNTRYGKLGMISLPYWLLFEFLGPLIEFSGYAVFLLFFLFGIINWPFFVILYLLVISAGFLYSFYAILVDLVSRQVYTKRKDFLAMIGTALLEPFYFHPIVVKAGVKGFIDYFKKSHSWGEMTRQGFNQETKNLPFIKRIRLLLVHGLKSYGRLVLAFSVLFLFGVLTEWAWYRYNYDNLNSGTVLKLFLDNTLFLFQFIFGFGLLFLLVYTMSQSWARRLAIGVFGAVVIQQIILFVYFSESGNLLGADVQFYNRAEIKQTLQATGMLNLKNFALALILLATVYIPFWLADRNPLKKTGLTITLIGIGFVSFFIPKTELQLQNNEFEQNAAKSKWDYFLTSNFNATVDRYPKIAGLLGRSEDFAATNTMLNQNFPFWKNEETPDFLGPLLDSSSVPPNVVVVIMEGFGFAYTSPKGYVGNFAPFLHSVSQKGLYWENALSSSGRTFGVLPSLLGSLPFGSNGYLEINKTPPHFNLYNVLKENGFSSGFYYGGDGNFDKMRQFLEYSKVDRIVDKAQFGNPFRKLPVNKGGESWGFEDQAVVTKMLQDQELDDQPYIDVILTLSTHSPFLINNEAVYAKRYNEVLQSNKLSATQKSWAQKHKKQLISMLNADDALKIFFQKYSARPDFKNTIFVITGDHSMPEIMLQSKIDRFHVPLVIYSPLVKEAKTFRSIVSHFDIAPSLLAYYRENYGFKTPKTVAWLGEGLTGNADLKDRTIPIMKSKDQLQNFVFENYHLEENQLFRLRNLQEIPVNDPDEKNRVSKKFSAFKAMNKRFSTSNKLMPDSVVVNYFQKKK